MIPPTRPNTPVIFEEKKFSNPINKKEIALMSVVALVGALALYIFLEYAAKANFTWDETVILCVRFSPFVIIPTLFALHLLDKVIRPQAKSRIIGEEAAPSIFRRVVKNPLI